MTKFSIITSCFNAEKYIAETIESVISQTEFLNSKCELEYIIIDGNSSDNTNSIIEHYKKKHSEIKHIIEKDEGLYDGLAKGFKIASGDIMAYLNAGDFFNKTAFSVLNKVFKNKRINWVTGLKVLYNQNSEIIDVQFPYKYRSSLIRSGVYGKYLPFIQQESTFWRTHLIKNLNYEYFKSLKRSGDMYLWFTFSEKYKLNVVYSYLSGFKYHENQLTFKETGTTDIYLEEASKFTKKKNILTFILIIFDSLFWFLGRNLSSIFGFFNSSHLGYSRNKNKWVKIQDKQKFKYKYFCWICDFRQSNGEGVASKMFLEEYSDKMNMQRNEILLQNTYNKKLFTSIDEEAEINGELNFSQKYLSPFIGILYLWFNFFLGKKVMYINFLPLWNFVIFALVPPGTILGPITGSKIYNKDNVKGFEKFFRKYCMPFQFRISNFILNWRYNNLIFTTNNLKEFLSKKVVKKSKFNFVYNVFQNNFNQNNIKNFNERDIDFIFYIRFYPSKGTETLVKYIEILKRKYKIVTVGELTNIAGIKEYGQITRNEVIKLCKNSKFTILSLENFNSLFSLECINSGTKVFFNNENEYEKKLENENKVFPINIYDIKSSIELINDKIRSIS